MQIYHSCFSGQVCFAMTVSSSYVTDFMEDRLTNALPAENKTLNMMLTKQEREREPV